MKNSGDCLYSSVSVLNAIELYTLEMVKMVKFMFMPILPQVIFKRQK